MPMTNMMMSPDEAKEYAGGCCAPTSPSEMPAYPYGLCVSLCDESLKKLGMSEPPKVGSKMVLTAIVEVVDAGQRKMQDGVEARAELQITDMMLDAPPTPIDAKAMYPNSNMS